PDGTELYFTRSSADWSNSVIMMASFDGEKWQEAKPVLLGGKKISGGDVHISGDGKRLFFSMDDEAGQADIWRSEKVGDQWLKPEKISKEVNSTMPEAYPITTH